MTPRATQTPDLVAKQSEAYGFNNAIDQIKSALGLEEVQSE